MTAEFVALPAGWVNIYHNKDTDKVYLEACPGVVTYTETVVTESLLRVATKTHMGYASFSSAGDWHLAAHRPHYVKTFFLGEDGEFTRELYDSTLVPLSQGNLWVVE